MFRLLKTYTLYAPKYLTITDTSIHIQCSKPVLRPTTAPLKHYITKHRPYRFIEPRFNWTWLPLLIIIRIFLWELLGFQGYIYYIVVYERFVNSSVELLIMWCLVVNVCQLFMDVLPPSAVPRGRPNSGMVITLRSYNDVVLLLCLWTYVLSVCYNFNTGWILEEHGRHDWTVSTWSIRVDPCSKYPYIYIYFSQFLSIYLLQL